MTTYLDPTPEGLEFGDVCAATFFADVRVSNGTLPVFKVPDTENLLNIKAYTESKRPTNLVVTAGRHCDRAVVVSDSCAVETALGRGDAKARGSIWFAPLQELKSQGAVEQAENNSDAFGRLLLRPDSGKETAWTVELQSAFAADAAAVRRRMEAERNQFLLHSLGPEVLDELRAKWAAVTSRSGPLVGQHNANHFLDRLEDRGVANSTAANAAEALMRVTAATWVLEGGSLEEAGALLPGDPSDHLDAAVDGIVQDLTALREQVDAALDALRPIASTLHAYHGAD